MAKKPKRINTGVTLEPDVIDYLESLGKREDRDRSWLINAIVREHAQRNAQPETKATTQRAPRK